MRIFTAIPLPDEVKEKLVEITRGKLPVPYISVTNAHITLNFLGELTEDESKKVLAIFPSLVGEKRPRFPIQFDKFVNFHQQIHLTLKENSDLKKFQVDLELGFRKIGFNFQDREFYPHVKLANMHIDNTLYRERKLVNFPNDELAQLNFVAESAALFESKLLLHHSHHQSLLEVKLI